MPYRLSKSKLQEFRQCPRRLWLSVYQSELAVSDEMTKLILDRGTDFGKAARACFPNGKLVESDGPEDAVRKTYEILDEFDKNDVRLPLFEAAFGFDDVVAYADVLVPLDHGQWQLVEIKSSAYRVGDSLKEHYVTDVATQACILRQTGLPVSVVSLGLANGQFRRGEVDAFDQILTLVDVTDLSLSFDIKETVRAAQNILDSAKEPEQRVGRHCKEPNRCPFIRHCSGAYPRAGEQMSVPVWHLSSDPTSKIVSDLMKDGYRNLASVPEDRLTKRMHRIMRSIAQGALPYVDDRLQAYLASVSFPRYFLDFETNNSPLPLWRGTRPGEVIPFQFSVHKWVNDQGHVEHHSFLAETIEDPRPELARKLVEVFEEPGPVFTWNGKRTDGPITERLAELSPSNGEILRRVAQSCKTNDLYPKFREYFYHPAMAGSWSLKSIAAALFPSSNYASLGIKNGVEAMRRYQDFITMREGQERDALRSMLLEYCNSDTNTLIEVWQKILLMKEREQP